VFTIFTLSDPEAMFEAARQPKAKRNGGGLE